MRKIVIAKECRFWPSKKVYLRCHELGMTMGPSKDDVVTANQPYEILIDEEENDIDKYSFRDFETVRADPRLVQAVEELGRDALDRSIKGAQFYPEGYLKIVEIPDNVQWEIHDYDCAAGEYIEEKHRIWE